MSKEKRRRDSRALIGAEDHSLIGSNTRISQYTQSENALKQRLKDIDHSHQKTNRRISHETHELKQILQGLQRDLKVSRPLHHYVPTQLEQRQVEPRRRRYTTSVFPAPEKLKVANKGLDDAERLPGTAENIQKVRRVENPSNAYLTKRRRSSSMPIMEEAKELRNIQEEAESEPRPADPRKDGGTEREEKSVLELAPKMSTSESADQDTKQTSIHNSSRSEKIYTKRLSAEQLLQNARKRSMAPNVGATFSNAFLGRFISSESSGAELKVVDAQPARSRRMTVGHRADMTEAPRKRLSVQENTALISAFQPTLRKSSLSYPQWSGNHSHNLNSARQGISPRMSPLTEMADELQFEGSGRRASQVAYRTRSRRRTTALTLPPVMEDQSAQKSAESQVWNELSSCRYLRRQENELTIDDIFRKD